MINSSFLTIFIFHDSYWLKKNQNKAFRVADGGGAYAAKKTYKPSVI
jgi:hypothetical protein